MRKKGAVSELSERRNRDLYEVYCRLLKEQLQMYGRVNKPSLLSKVVNMPASRYWISPERGYSVIADIRKGKINTIPSKNKIKLYNALYQEYLTYKETHPKMSDIKIVEDIVYLPAPCFGIEPRVAGFIIKKMEVKCKQEKIRKLKLLYQ